MPNCDFYALPPDLLPVVEFIFDQPGWRLMELSSEPDRPLREFRRTRELLEAFPQLNDPSSSLPIHLQLYADAMGGSVLHRRIELNPGAVPNATHRYASEGWGLIQLYLELPRQEALRACHTNHFTEAGARKWETASDPRGPVAAWNWAEVMRTSSRLNRFVRSRATRKLGSRPVLNAADVAEAAGLVQFRLT